VSRCHGRGVDTIGGERDTFTPGDFERSSFGVYFVDFIFALAASQSFCVISEKPFPLQEF